MYAANRAAPVLRCRRVFRRTEEAVADFINIDAVVSLAGGGYLGDRRFTYAILQYL